MNVSPPKRREGTSTVPGEKRMPCIALYTSFNPHALLTLRAGADHVSSFPFTASPKGRAHL